MSGLFYYKKEFIKEENAAYDYDVVIYGATPAGITAAIQTKKDGLTCGIVEVSHYIGGMTTSGLGATDLGSPIAVGGLSKEFYSEVAKFYGQEKQYKFEPHVAQAIFDKWLAEYEVPIHLLQPLESVRQTDGKISSIVSQTGAIFSGKVFIDATYEGDLLGKAAISYRVGRESNSEYQEIYNGIQFKDQHHKFEQWIDPYKIEGKPESGLLAGIQNIPLEELGYNGRKDDTIQAYNFRICLTDVDENKVPFPKPENYNSEEYALLLR